MVLLRAGPAAFSLCDCLLRFLFVFSEETRAGDSLGTRGKLSASASPETHPKGDEEQMRK